MKRISKQCKQKSGEYLETGHSSKLKTARMSTETMRVNIDGIKERDNENPSKSYEEARNFTLGQRGKYIRILSRGLQ